MKKLSIILFSLLVTFSIKAQNENISTIFVSIPDSFLIGLDVEQKAELVQMPDSANVAVTTGIGEQVERIALSDDYIALKTSDVGSLEVKLLPLVNGTYIIAVISTVCGPACDSHINFYTTAWVPLSTRDLFPEKDKAWFLDLDKIDNPNVIDNLSAILDMTPIKLSFVSGDTSIGAAYDIQKYLSPEDYKVIEPCLIKDPITFTWDKSSYRKQ